MAGEFLDNRVRHALNEKRSSRKVPQVVDAEILNFGEVADSSEPLSKIPGVRFEKLLHILKSDVRLGREHVFMLSVAGELPERINYQPGTFTPARGWTARYAGKIVPLSLPGGTPRAATASGGVPAKSVVQADEDL